MMKIARVAAALLPILLQPILLRADDACTPVGVGDRIEIELDNGRKLSGKVQKLTDAALTLDLSGETGIQGKLEFERRRIAAVTILKARTSAEERQTRESREAEYAGKIKALLDAADAAEKAGDTATAAEKSRDALRASPNDAEVRKAALLHLRNRGVDLLSKSQFSDAAPVFGEVLDLDPANGDAQLGLGFCRYKERSFGEALDPLEKAVKAFPTRADAFSALAYTYYWLDDLEPAERCIQEARKLNPDYKDAEVIAKQIAAERKAESESQVIRGDTFVIKFKGAAADAAFGNEVLAYLEQAAVELEKRLDGSLQGPLRVVLHTDEEFRDQLKVPDHVRGYYSSGERKIHVPAARAQSDPEGFHKTLTHELTHALIHAMTEDCPTWLHEALAQECAGQIGAAEAARSRAAFAARDARGELIALPALEEAFATSRDNAKVFGELYIQAWCILDYLGTTYGRDKFPELIKTLGSGASIDAACSAVFGKTLEEIDADWRTSLKGGG